jgi:hypothetical protein
MKSYNPRLKIKHYSVVEIGSCGWLAVKTLNKLSGLENCHFVVRSLRLKSSGSVCHGAV